MVIMRSGEATTILPGRKSLKNFDELFTPSTSFNTFRSVLLRLWKLRIRWQCKWNLFAGEKRCRGIGRTRTLREHYLENEISGIKHQWKFSEEVARSELEAMERRCSLSVILSKSSILTSQSENTRDRQEMLSVRLWKNLQKVTRLWWCKKLKVSRIFLKDEWKKMKEEWHMWLYPKNEKPYVVKETICCMNTKYFFKSEKKEK